MQEFDVVTDGRGESRDARNAEIHAAAIEQFILRGFAGTSMAHIAEAAGMSRPALYQYFSNKVEIFASAFVAVFEQHSSRAIVALAGSGTTTERLDGFLQRFEGDMWQLLAGSPHAEEILRAKNARVSESIDIVVSRLWESAEELLMKMHPGRSRLIIEQRAAWIEVLRCAPRGFMFDRPPIETFRRRLETLAGSLGAAIDAKR